MSRAIDNDPVLNTATLDQYAKRKMSLLERLAMAYLEEAPLFHTRIRDGMAAKDLDAVKLNSHALKSCSHNLGAIRLAKLAQEIETAAGNSDSLRLEILMEKLGPNCFEAEEALRGAMFKYTGKPFALLQQTKKQPELAE